MEELLQSFVLYNTYSRSFCGCRQTFHSPADALNVCALQGSRHDSVLTVHEDATAVQCSAVQCNTSRIIRIDIVLVHVHAQRGLGKFTRPFVPLHLLR